MTAPVPSNSAVPSPPTAAPRLRRRGFMLVLVLVAVGVALVTSLSFITSSVTTTQLTAVLYEKAQARQAAESGLAMSVEYLRRDPEWRSNSDVGEWIKDTAVLDAELSIEAAFTPEVLPADALNDAGFESEAATLSNPVLAPPMSGSVGGWDIERTALIETGATVPWVGVRASASATEGGNEAFVEFGASVSGGATFSQTLPHKLEPNSAYTLSVDVTTSYIKPFDSTFGFRVYADGTLVASSEEAFLLTEWLTAEQIQAEAEAWQDAAQEPATLMETVLAGTTARYTLNFVTDDEPPPAGDIRIELFVNSIGLASSVAFDNLAFVGVPTDPVVLTATGRTGSSTHTAIAAVSTGLGGVRVSRWSEP